MMAREKHSGELALPARAGPRGPRAVLHIAWAEKITRSGGRENGAARAGRKKGSTYMRLVYREIDTSKE